MIGVGPPDTFTYPRRNRLEMPGTAPELLRSGETTPITLSVREKLMSAFALSMLDCCIAVLANLPKSTNPLQLVGYSMRPQDLLHVSGHGPRDHLTSSLQRLYIGFLFNTYTNHLRCSPVSERLAKQLSKKNFRFIRINWKASPNGEIFA